MKTITSIISIFALALSIHAKEITKDVTVTQATVYLKGAKVTASTPITLPKGKNYVRLENLPRDMNPNTISINLPKTVSLMSVTPELQTLKPFNANAEELRMQEEIKKNSRKIQLIQVQIQMLNNEKAKKVKKHDKKISKKLKKTKTKNVAQLDKLTDHYDKKLLATENALTLLNEQHKELQNRNKQLQEQINQGKPTNNKVLGYDVVLELENSAEQTIDLTISYLVDNAGWVPNYDIRAKTDEKLVEITYKGRIYQNTGQEWNNITLSVSSYKPNYNTQRPVLNPLYASQLIQTPQHDGYTFTASGSVQVTALGVGAFNLYQSAPMTVSENLYRPDQLDKHLAEPATWNAVTDSPLSVIYELHKNHTIPSQMNPQHIFLDSKEVSAEYVYHAVPSISSEVHLLAKVKNWNELNLMGGEAFLFLGDNFVGKTVINSKYTQDELPIALGTDERIIVRRTRMSDKPENKNKQQGETELHAYEITYKNNMNFDVTLEILDQIPLSLTQRIKILEAQYEDGELSESTGALLWTRELPAGKSGQVVFSYKVNYEKGVLVQFKRG
jgi:uncharacterized protein (TIGR02231 family)